MHFSCSSTSLISLLILWEKQEDKIAALRVGKMLGHSYLQK